jgi:hypothetical protein
VRLKKTKVYVSGKITGDPDYFNKFMRAAHELRMKGYEVVNPVEVNFGREADGWNACLRRDIAAMMSCDGICLLPDWEDSRCAQLERTTAVAVGMEVMLYTDLVL